MTRATFVALPLILALVACGTSRKEFVPSEEEKQSAVNVVDSTQSLESLKADARSNTAINQFSQIQSNSQYLISMQQGRGSALSSPLEALTSAASLDDCAVDSGGTVTYNNCDYGSGTINGTVNVAGDTITVDLTINAYGSSQSLDLSYKGAVTVSATGIDGGLTVKYDISGLNYSIDIDYNAIALDANGCAIGGSLIVDADWSYAGLGSLGGAGSSSASVEVNFGPACGEMTMLGA
jgi:hypothetical protein